MNRTTRLCLAAGVGLSLLAATSPTTADEPATPAAPAAAVPDHSDLDAILKAAVRDGRVDYLLVRRDHWPALTGYLDRMGDVDHERLGDADRLALYCNLYNATMISTVVERFHAGYTPAENNKQIFRDSLVRVRGRTITFNELEHQLIRAGFGEPRIHAALVCGGLGCPRHPDHAYRGDTLDAQLEADMAAWVNDPEKNAVNDNAGTAVMSKLFNYYADDFGGPDALVAYLDRYHESGLLGMAVTFSDAYDWTLNLAPPADGRWVMVAAETAALLDGPSADAKSVGSTFRRATFEAVGEQGGMVKIERPFGGGEAWVAAEAVEPFRYVGPDDE